MRTMITAVGTVAVAGLLGRTCRDWGATAQERQAVLPGEELIADPADVTTRGVSIAASPEEVWRWLVQIGQGGPPNTHGTRSGRS
jgi:hypothetical protein